MIAGGIIARAPLELADCQKEASDAEQLQQERPRLLNSAALLRNDRRLGLSPKTERRDLLNRYSVTTTPPTALKIAKNSSGLRFKRNTYCTPPARIIGPKIASSTEVSTVRPT